MKILYFGSDVFLPVFQDLVESDHKIVALYTYHDDREYIRDEGVVALARAHDIPVHHDRITEAEMIALCQSGAVDLVLSAEYDRKIPTPDIPEYHGVNIHNSLLPEGKGYFPIEMRLYQGYDYGGVTLHKMVERFDCGELVLQEKFDILPQDNDRSLYQKCAQLARSMVKNLLDNMKELWENSTPQPPDSGSYWYLPKEEDYTILPTMDGKTISHIYRSFGRFARVKLGEELLAVEHLVCIPKGETAQGMAIEGKDCTIDLTLQETPRDPLRS